jgi:hypothetical protein
MSLVAQASRLCERRLKPPPLVDAAEGGGATFLLVPSLPLGNQRKFVSGPRSSVFRPPHHQSGPRISPGCSSGGGGGRLGGVSKFPQLLRFSIISLVAAGTKS